MALLIAVLAPPTAPANFHLTKISEVFPGTGLCPDCSFIELQAYAAGQNVVGGHTLRSYGATGAIENTFMLPGGVPNAENQRTILIGDDSVTGRDFTDTALGTNLVPSGGAVCFDALDCVAWGNFTGVGALPIGAAVGTPAVDPGGISNASSLVRSIAPGCATLLEAGDDSDDSATDFSLSGVPSPRGNSVTPTEVPCTVPTPGTVIDKGPKKKLEGGKATFKFSSPDGGASFECKLDEQPFKPCTSPRKLKRIEPGRHVFSVRAVLAGKSDPQPGDLQVQAHQVLAGAARRARSARTDEIVAVLDQVTDEGVRGVATERNRDPVALVQVVARNDRLVGGSEPRRHVRVALDADSKWRRPQRREGEDLAADLEGGSLRAERERLLRPGHRQA